MSTKLKTIKVTEAAADNFKTIAFVLKKNQYEASEYASNIMIDLLRGHPDLPEKYKKKPKRKTKPSKSKQ